MRPKSEVFRAPGSLRKLLLRMLLAPMCIILLCMQQLRMVLLALLALLRLLVLRLLVLRLLVLVLILLVLRGDPTQIDIAIVVIDEATWLSDIVWRRNGHTSLRICNGISSAILSGILEHVFKIGLSKPLACLAPFRRKVINTDQLPFSSLDAPMRVYILSHLRQGSEHMAIVSKIDLVKVIFVPVDVISLYIVDTIMVELVFTRKAFAPSRVGCLAKPGVRGPRHDVSNAKARKKKKCTI